jgi:hypothetical protein
MVDMAQQREKTTSRDADTKVHFTYARRERRGTHAASSDGGHLGDYRRFVDEVVGRRNRRNAKRLEVERGTANKALMRVPTRANSPSEGYAVNLSLAVF